MAGVQDFIDWETVQIAAYDYVQAIVDSFD
jgi:hypothetical protein